jgi:hypothetical protein
MLSSVECLARAAELDAIARVCIRKSERDSYIETAEGWRRTAIIARRQEAWETLHPPV